MKHLLVATDLSEESLAALDFAAEQGRMLPDMQITLVAVLVDPGITMVEFGFSVASIDWTERFAEAAKNAEIRLTNLARERLGLSNVKTKIINAADSVAAEIASYARAERVDAVVMATHGRTGLRHLLLGSVTSGVLRELVCPVFVVPTSGRGGKQTTSVGSTYTILVLSDFSEASRPVFDLALQQFTAMKNRGALLHLFHVVADLLVASYHRSLGSDPEAIWREQETQSLEKLEDDRARYFGGTTALTTVVRQEHTVGEDIVQFASAHHADLVVLGTHGRRGVRHMMLGSVAETVARLSRCPVLVVPVTKAS